MAASLFVPGGLGRLACEQTGNGRGPCPTIAPPPSRAVKQFSRLGIAFLVMLRGHFISVRCRCGRPAAEGAGAFGDAYYRQRTLR